MEIKAELWDMQECCWGVVRKASATSKAQGNVMATARPLVVTQTNQQPSDLDHESHGSGLAGPEFRRRGVSFPR